MESSNAAVSTLISEEWMGFSSKKPGNSTPQQIHRDGRDGAFGRQVFAVQMVDAADARVGRDQLVRELRDRFHREGFTTKERGNKDFVGAPVCRGVQLKARMNRPAAPALQLAGACRPATVTDESSTVEIGPFAVAMGWHTVAIGLTAVPSGSSAVVMGSIAVGFGSVAVAIGSSAVGVGLTAVGVGLTAVAFVTSAFPAT